MLLVSEHVVWLLGDLIEVCALKLSHGITASVATRCPKLVQEKQIQVTGRSGSSVEDDVMVDCLRRQLIGINGLVRGILSNI